MNKKMVLVAALLVNMVTAVSGTDFEERITEKKWYRDYFNEVIYGQDRNIIVEYQSKLTKEENIYFYVGAYDDMIFWFDEPSYYRDRLDYIKLDDSEYGSHISMCGGGGDSAVKPGNLLPICMRYRLKMCAFHRKSMNGFWNVDRTGSLP